MAERTCSVPGCDKPHRARGLCATHWMREYGKKARPQDTACVICGKSVVRYIKSGQRPVCSVRCRTVLQRDAAWEHKQVVLHPKPVPIIETAKPKPAPPVTRKVRFTAGMCSWCGAGFILDRFQFENGKATHCSARCTKSHGRYRRKARERGAYVADVIPREVFQRDGWRCQVCWRKVNAKAKAPHPRSATVDHIIPLSCGGTHEPINCQTACFMCNATKSNRHGYGDQLRLIA